MSGEAHERPRKSSKPLCLFHHHHAILKNAIMKAMQSEREGDFLHPLVCVVTERVPGWNNVWRNQFFTMHVGLLTYVRVPEVRRPPVGGGGALRGPRRRGLNDGTWGHLEGGAPRAGVRGKAPMRTRMGLALGARVRYHIYLDSHGFGAHRDVCPRRHIAGEDWGGALGLTDPWNGSVVEEGAQQRLATARRLAFDSRREI